MKEDGKQVTHISITGYSLGGLIARYLIGYVRYMATIHVLIVLFSILDYRGFFETTIPVNFTTFTTPHVGLAPYPYMAWIWYWLGSKFLGRTGVQFFCEDKWSNTDRPLLDLMSDKCK